MTTPPPDTPPAAETLEEIVKDVIRLSRCGPIQPDGVAVFVTNVLHERIVAALRNRDERAAKITDDILPIGSDDCYWCERVKRAAAAIREGK